MPSNDIPNGKYCYPQSSLRYFDLEREASHVDLYISFLVNGLFQTEQYMRALYEKLPAYFRSRMSEDAFVEFRIKRQWEAFERPKPLRMHVVINEAAIRNAMGDNQMMYEQVLHLIRLAEQPHILLQVLPINSSFQFIMYSAPDLTVFHFDDSERGEMIFMEQGARHYISDNEHETGSYMADFLQAAHNALSPNATIALLRKVAKGYAERS